MSDSEGVLQDGLKNGNVGLWIIFKFIYLHFIVLDGSMNLLLVI